MTDATVAIGAGVARREVALADYLDPSVRRSRQGREPRLDQESPTCQRRWRAAATAVHVSRRLAVVVRRVVSAQAAGRARDLPHDCVGRTVDRDRASATRWPSREERAIARQLTPAGGGPPRRPVQRSAQPWYRASAMRVAAMDARARWLHLSALAARVGTRPTPGRESAHRRCVHPSGVLARGVGRRQRRVVHRPGTDCTRATIDAGGGSVRQPRSVRRTSARAAGGHR